MAYTIAEGGWHTTRDMHASEVMLGHTHRHIDTHTHTRTIAGFRQDSAMRRARALRALRCELDQIEKFTLALLMLLRWSAMLWHHSVTDCGSDAGSADSGTFCVRVLSGSRSSCTLDDRRALEWIVGEDGGVEKCECCSGLDATVGMDRADAAAHRRAVIVTRSIEAGGDWQMDCRWLPKRLCATLQEDRSDGNMVRT